MCTETSIGENVGEIKEEPSATDLGLVIGKFSVSPTPYKGSCLRADDSSTGMGASHVSVADFLLPDFDISLDMHSLQRDDEQRDTIKSDAFDPVGKDPFGQTPDGGKDTNKFNSSNTVSISEPSAQRNGESGVLGEINKTRKSKHLIVYKSSRRSAFKNTSNQDNESPKTSGNSRRITNKNSVVDLSSMRILRRRRSLFPKQARSSVWGSVGNILPYLEESFGLNLTLGNEKKHQKARAVKNNWNAIKDQKVQKSMGKSCTPAGHISLKIRIGNQAIGNITESSNGSRESIKFNYIKDEVGEEVLGDIVWPCDFSLEKTSSGNSAVISHIGDRGGVENPSFVTSSDHHQIISQVEGHNLGASTRNMCSDPGTSPDSEVINSVPDAPLLENCLENMQDSPVVSKPWASSLVDVSSFSLPQIKSKKGKKIEKLHQLGDSSEESKLAGAETTNHANLQAELGEDQKVGHVSYCTDASTITTAKPYCSDEVSRCLSRCSRVSDSGTATVSSIVSNGAEINPSSGLVCAETDSSKSQICETWIPCSNEEKLSQCSGEKGGSKSMPGVLGLPRKKDKASKKKRNIKKLGSKYEVEEVADAVDTNNVPRGVESHLEAGHQISSDPEETGTLNIDLSGPISSSHFSSCGEKDRFAQLRNAWVLCDECQKWRRIPATLADRIEETNCRWTCKDNTDGDFADCSIPQEKSNSEINEELEISDASCEEDSRDTFPTSKHNRPKVAQQSSWSLIKSNLFLHRSRKKQTIDEVMVCHCKPPSDGRRGCGSKCLNRMLNIECVRGTCPCGEFCSNQQFQKRKYARLKWIRCGKKGHGLQVLENISEGQFLIEYVGEVLDVPAYEARQREYALNGHKHFYFMTLNGSEVIDACAKGNLGRFINHSCDPNCRTEKWMVNGEVCVGLFAVRDIKKGEEVTFDYNYVRVFGAAAKKCVCGSPNCRGYIGGDPTNSEVIVQGDSDDEHSEPVMTCEDREMKSDWTDIMLNTLNDRDSEIGIQPPKITDRTKKRVNVVGHLESVAETHSSETLSQKVEGVNITSTCACVNTSIVAQIVQTMAPDEFEVDNSVDNDSANNTVGHLDVKKDTAESLNSPASVAFKVESEGDLAEMHSTSHLKDVSLLLDGIMNKEMSSVHHEYSSGQKSKANSLSFAPGLEMTTAISPSKSLPHEVECKRNLKYSTLGGKYEPAKSYSLAKTCRSSSSIKKGKLKSNDVNDKGIPDVDRLNVAAHKFKKQPEFPLNSQLETVEEKLNDLLDPEGGISKRKDASRGYLKLLFLTAASGNNGHGEAIQSNRDLSMILDVLLKTKSRTVLVDILNKNGLQMLHNIMKRYRTEFIKTPILRKLLKVLEYLAVREILTLGHITGGPPCPGVESFKDSILTLTEHADKQVHQIARNFRDRWIPRSLRKIFCLDRDNRRIEFHPRSNGSLSVPHEIWSDRGGKPSEAANSHETQSASVSCAIETSTIDHSASVSICGMNGKRTRKRKSRWDIPAEENLHSRIKTSLEGDGKPKTDEDFPPGFPSPFNGPTVPSNSYSTAIIHQEKDACIKHPFDIVSGDSQQRFIARMPVSYGLPSSVMKQFGVLQAETCTGYRIAPGVPFHSFPPLPPYACDKRNPPTSAARCGSFTEPAEKAEQGSDTCITQNAGRKHTRTWTMDQQETNFSVKNDWPDFQQGGGSSSLGRKYFRQQKLNHSKLAPPWVRMRNGWGHVCNNSIGNGANEYNRNSSNLEDVNWRGEF
ncbi:hypothetical protein ACJIZ3_024639 [Penstemon smallii]|uniref:Histone-lysine N-methyltransferase ASHH2 n=1 Tax=Penstemon smallii TaxID=265156 RepID=A0ABD3TVL9_9LAMI